VDFNFYVEYFKAKTIDFKNWLVARSKERTTWDGIVIVAISLGVIVFHDLFKLLAWGGVAYGLFTIYKKEL
jgi:hypothetical protein